MRVNLEGINWSLTKLADGTTRKYWYAWRGGPRFRGEPGTADFIVSYNEAVAERVPSPQGRLQALLDSYQASGEFRGLREPHTRRLCPADRDHRTRIRRLPN